MLLVSCLLVYNARPKSKGSIYQLFWLEEILYVLTTGLTKVSILFMYLRIFPSYTFKLTAYGILGFTICFICSILMAAIFNCKPIPLAWEGWDGEHPGKCNNMNALAAAHAAINIPLDIAIIILPAPSLVKLQLGRKKKIGLLVMFSVGIL